MSAILTAAVLAAALSAAPAPAPKDEDANAWPAVKNSDFKLTAELVAPSKKDDKGVLQLADKTVLQIKLKAEKDCDAAVFWIDPRGHVIQLFPNRHEKDSHLKAGVERVLPGANADYSFEAVPTEGDGNDKLHVVAMTGSLPATPSGEQFGPYIAFRSETARKEVARTIRGIVIKAKSDAPTEIKISQAELLFHVNR
jgi:hypothetical protein